MTNANIILNESIRLMNEGIIGTTGRTFEIVDENGETKQIAEPEALHTYQAWKQMGYQVQKGEKAIAKFKIWKCTRKAEEIETENGEIVIDKKKMFLVNASFFKASQVAKIQ